MQQPAPSSIPHAGSVSRSGYASSFHDANFPVDEDGCAYHLGVKRGQVANRIVTVGSVHRAEVLAEMLDWKAPPVRSQRGFVTFTGLKNGVPVSIVTSLMGIANMDMALREACELTDGDLAVVRLGTCGTPNRDVKIGQVAVASAGSVVVMTNPDAVLARQHGASDGPGGDLDAYTISDRIVPADPELSALVVEELRRTCGQDKVVEGLNVTADTFYAAQGRTCPSFSDRNMDLMMRLNGKYPQAVSLEMETYHLLYLSAISRGRIRSTGAHIVLAQRHTNEFLDNDERANMEESCGHAVIQAVSRMPIKSEMGPQGTVWENAPKAH